VLPGVAVYGGVTSDVTAGAGRGEGKPGTTSTLRYMSTDESGHVRLRVEMVLEIADLDALTSAARRRGEEDSLLSDEERAHATEAISHDAAEAVAYLVDPVDLVVEVPGVRLAQATWSSELADYDPDEMWDSDEERSDE
jgi:hypothetical protein